MTQFWYRSSRGDKRALPLADRHYNRQKVGSPQFVPPGRCLVLLTEDVGALWVTSYPYAQYVRHQWAGALINSLFRRESGEQASTLIRAACAATRVEWELPPLGMVTFVNAKKVLHKRDPGRCYLRAGFSQVGETKGGLLAFQLLPSEFPDAEEALER